MDVMAGNVPNDNASAADKSQYDRNDGKAMAILISSVDNEQANHILMCKTAKEIADKLSNLHLKRSENLPIITTECADTTSVTSDRNSNCTDHIINIEKNDSYGPNGRDLNIPEDHSSSTTMTPQEIAMWIDRRSRVLFPVMFLVFNAFYWTYVYFF